MSTEGSSPTALVIGGGPAGLMAASELLAAGMPTILTEAMPTAGRKLLMAGKSGLNLTMDEPEDQFQSRYPSIPPQLKSALAAFGPQEVKAWAEDLGIELFTGSSGRVFPRGMKGSPLLRALLARLKGQGLDLRLRWRWIGPDAEGQVFETPEGRRIIRPAATVLALGGGSWARLGSDGSWMPILAEHGFELHPFKPSNMGFNVNWTQHMVGFFGKPLKPLALRAGDATRPWHRGELVITRRGLEGGGLYPLSAALREGAPLFLDLLPDLPLPMVVQRLANRPKGETLAATLRKALHLDGTRIAIAQEFARPWPMDPAARAEKLKSLPVALSGPFALDEAISTAGGLAMSGLGPDLMVLKSPGLFAAGEMLDWDAPTGGYLLTACLATGRAAGRGAAAWVKGGA